MVEGDAEKVNKEYEELVCNAVCQLLDISTDTLVDMVHVNFLKAGIQMSW